MEAAPPPLFVRVLSRGFLAALPSPLRRIPAALYATTPNAAHHHCIMHGEALPQLRFSPPPLHERRTVRLALSGRTSATPQRPIFQEQSRARLTAPRSASNRLAASGRLAPRQVSCDIWALQLRPRRDDRAHRSCWQVCRPGSVATRWEYRNNPLVDLEKVRAFAMRHTCTHPSLCPMLTGALSRLDLRRPAVAERRAPTAAGPLRQWGHGAPRWTSTSASPKRCAAAGTARIWAPSRPSCSLPS